MGAPSYTCVFLEKSALHFFLPLGEPRLTYLQAETAAFEDSKSYKASDYVGATLYTTLSPCDMCAGACLLYNIKRLVIGDNSTMSGREPYLKQRGVEVIVLNNGECKHLLEAFIERRPDVW